MTYTNSLIEHFAWSYSMSEDVSSPELRAEFGMQPRRKQRWLAALARLFGRGDVSADTWARLGEISAAAPKL